MAAQPVPVPTTVTGRDGQRVLAALGLSSLALATGSNIKSHKGFDSKEMGNYNEKFQ